MNCTLFNVPNVHYLHSMIEALAGPRPKMRADLEKTGVLGELGYKAGNVRRF